VRARLRAHTLSDIADRLSKGEQMPQCAEGLRLLVVEDDPTMSLIILAQLGKLNGSVSLVENGLMAIRAWIAALEDQPFDAIIMDIHMPVMSGLMALKEIRRLEIDLEVCRTPIISFSAEDTVAGAEFGHEIGFDAVLSKPNHIDHLLPTIQQLTRQPFKLNPSGPQHEHRF
jgi:CheY-like chemotaxis protein